MFRTANREEIVVTIATTSDQTEIQSSIRAWAKSAEPTATTRKQENDPNAWRAHWPQMVELGLTSVAISEEHGGAGADIVDLACMLEETAAALVPGPLLTTAVVGVLVDRAGGAVAETYAARFAEGDIQAGILLDPQATVLDASSGTISGEVGVVVGGTTDGAVLLPVQRGGETVWVLLAGDAAGKSAEVATPFDISANVAVITVDNTPVDDAAVLSGVTTELVHRLAVTLAAAEMAGVGDYTLRTAVEYAKIREQFGRTIGSFQSIKHLAANMLCRTEEIRALAWDAAVAADEALRDGTGHAADSEFDISAATAGALAFDLAVKNSQDCIQILGGIGFTFEHDAHFYMRKAGALRQAVGGSSRWRRDLAGLTLAGRRRHLDIDLSDVEGIEQTRAEVKELVAAVAAKPDGEERRRALAESGLFMPHLPEPWGRGASAAEQLVIDEELEAAGVKRHDITIGGWAVPTVLQAAPQHAEQFVLPTMAGELRWCQLFSEPGAGSDLAALTTKAEKVDGGWKINGQKVWTSLAREADWAMCLARTDKDAPKHKGITYFLVDMKSAGIRTAPLREITGEALFNEVFLEDLFVPDEYQIGEVNGGWKIARTTLANERVAMGGGSSLGDAVEELLGLMRAAGLDTDPVTLDELGRHVADAVAGSLLDLRTAIRTLAGNGPGAESAVRKIVGVRHRQDVAEFAFGLVGGEGYTFTEAGRKFLMVRCLSIAGGTEQVLLNVAGERILGLPRD